METAYNSDLLLHFKSITESANDAIISIDQSGTIIFWNSKAEQIFGYKSEEAVGKNVEIIIPEHFVPSHRKGIQRVIEGGEHRVIGQTAELTGKHKSGREFPIELSLSTWKSESEQFFNGIIRDITERKQAVMRLLDSEHKFRSITETANDAIIAADQNGNILSWNKAAERIFGYTSKEVEGKSLTIIIPERFRKDHERGISRVVRTGKHKVIGHTVELYGLRKDGSEFPIELSLSAWKTESGQYFCGIIRDISQRKAAELALLKSEENLKEKTKKLKKANHEIHLKNEQLEGLSQKLAKYLSREVYHSIFSGQKDVKIESYRKKLSVFFSDIQGFTELTDRVESEVLTSILNSYLNEMSKIAHQHGGTIDKFIGDAIMIFFGDPETKGAKEDAYCCVKMALDMRNQLKNMQKQWELMGIANPLRVRMGINTGYCTVGNFGSDDRMDYTIVGSQVNLASRLESLAETDQILISQDTYTLIREKIECVKKEEVKVKGIAYPVQTYQVVDFIDNLKKRNEKIQSRLDGFKISLDLKKMSSVEKDHVKEILGEAMKMLDGKQ